ncbi:MAG TPA: hypothetical protein VLI67_02605 [Vicinamibacteria bacterium]|nr:hypothetical protein [Vicinamibacteria bacterium]
MTSLELGPGVPVVLYLHSPREKLWGVLVSLQPAGIVIRGLDLAVFDDWVRQEQRGEEGIGLSTLFYPMSRVERMERDETSGPLESLADRFERQVGRSVFEVLGLR